MNNAIIEEWRDIPGFEGLYQASNIGRIKSCDRITVDCIGRKKTIRSKILRLHDNGQGYYKVHLCNNGTEAHEYVHRLVCMTFHPVHDLNRVQVNHIDEDPGNNRADNLEWVTCKENVNHGGYIQRVKKTLRKNGNKFCKKTICGGKVYHSLNACCRFYHISNGTMSSYLSGRYKMPQKFVDLGLRFA